MCQYNLIIMNENCSETILEEEGYRLFVQQEKGRKIYNRWTCDCGSCVSSQKEEKDISYNEFMLIKKKEKIEELLRIKQLLQEPDYKEQMDEYDRYLDYFSKEYSDFYEKFDKITPELAESLANTPEYKRINELSEKMYEMDIKYALSANYTLSTDKSRALEKIPIDKALDEVKKEENQEGLLEFHSLYNLFKKLLEVSPFLEFVPIWISFSDFMEGKTVSIQSLTIEDLSKLQYNQKLIITK